MQALVSGVPKGALVMLDLYAEVFPLWKATNGFHGADFIFCMLHNFGGNIEMYGALPAVAAAPGEPMHGSGGGMIGVGMCPECIEQNPIVYDLMSEWAFRQAPLRSIHVSLYEDVCTIAGTCTLCALLGAVRAGCFLLSHHWPLMSFRLHRCSA